MNNDSLFNKGDIVRATKSVFNHLDQRIFSKGEKGEIISIQDDLVMIENTVGSIYICSQDSFEIREEDNYGKDNCDKIY